ncbi:ABC transporter permease [Methanococcoides methylutens]|uniref:ABC transporter, permease protein n=1 Tax=Methanococcoides methylutens MM1 TaxID=1434104 RepID=A0A0E3STB1_METMT|nr:FtsX-like permease family protein [Methanococcoides methylutens]AKB86028.1 ABC transporter, permease protein [Methanococcoides methylutens MM1]
MKDIFRRKNKLAIAVLGVIVAASAIVAVVTTFSAATDSLYEESTNFGANIIVRPQTDSIPLIAGSTSIGSISTGENYIEQTDIPRIYGIENNANLAVVAPRLYGVAETGNDNIIVMGVDIGQEKILRSWWNVEGEWLSNPEGMEVLLGKDIAIPLGLEVGSTFPLEKNDIFMELEVKGIIESTGGEEDGYIIMPLLTSQKLLDREGKISSIEIRALCNDCPVSEMSRQIEGVLPGIEARAMSQIVQSEMAMIDHTRNSAMAVSFITLLVSTLTVASTMLASVNEKIKEIGIMRAIGASDRQVITMLFIEGALIGMIGGSIGFFAGSLTSYSISPLLGFAEPSPMWELLPLASGISIMVGLVASILPARRALKIDPAEVLRSV